MCANSIKRVMCMLMSLHSKSRLSRVLMVSDVSCVSVCPVRAPQLDGADGDEMVLEARPGISPPWVFWESGCSSSLLL